MPWFGVLRFLGNFPFTGKLCLNNFIPIDISAVRRTYFADGTAKGRTLAASDPKPPPHWCEKQGRCGDAEYSTIMKIFLHFVSLPLFIFRQGGALCSVFTTKAMCIPSTELLVIFPNQSSLNTLCVILEKYWNLTFNNCFSPSTKHKKGYFTPAVSCFSINFACTKNTLIAAVKLGNYSIKVGCFLSFTLSR